MDVWIDNVLLIKICKIIMYVRAGLIPNLLLK